jgi:hypothetical protein
MALWKCASEKLQFMKMPLRCNDGGRRGDGEDDDEDEEPKAVVCLR